MYYIHHVTNVTRKAHPGPRKEYRAIVCNFPDHAAQELHLLCMISLKIFDESF